MLGSPQQYLEGDVSLDPPNHSTSDEAAHWIRIKSVLLGALDLPASERAAFIDRVCGDDHQLKHEVDALLASEAAAASLYEVPAAHLLTRNPPTESPRLQAGTHLGAYNVTGFVASGGMGEVYRAVHTVLGRVVAIKTVRASSRDDAARRRLLREARNAATLSHPNICTIHEVGDSPDGPFIVMEFVDGELLSARLQEHALSFDDALTYALQTTGALEHAHERGILHRDLKSSNVMVTPGGRAVVLDFGLAKRFSETGAHIGDATKTVDGALTGTLSHMAPEVLRGGPATVRSDVWSLGVVLYELFSRQLPFSGRTPYETSSAIFDEPPRPLNALIPLALRLVIERCMMKDPDARYQSASEVRIALEAIQRKRGWPLVGPLLISVRRRSMQLAALVTLGLPAVLVGGYQLTQRFTAPPISAVAMLPLENGTGDPNARYYAEGLTDALIAQLGELTGVRVARRVDADVVVQGTLNKSGERVSVDLKLLDQTRERVLWAERFERDAANVLALQTDIVQALTLALRLAARPEPSERYAVVRAVNPTVYEYYLKGRYAWNQRTSATLDSAVSYFQRAVELDPTYAPAHAALADCYNQFGTVMISRGTPRDWRARAEAAAVKALQIDPHSAEARAALGYVRHYQLRWQDAEYEFRRAIQLNPSYSLARVWYANMLMSLRRFDEAIAQLTEARQLDPFSLVVNTNIGWVLTAAGRAPEAVVHLQRTLAIDSTYPQARTRLALALMLSGRHPEAATQMQWLIERGGRLPHYVATLAHNAAYAGDTATAGQLVAELVARREREYVPAYSIASTLAALGDYDRAAAFMEKAFDEQSNGIAYLAADAALGQFRKDARIRPLMDRAGLGAVAAGL